MDENFQIGPQFFHGKSPKFSVRCPFIIESNLFAPTRHFRSLPRNEDMLPLTPDCHSIYECLEAFFPNWSKDLGNLGFAGKSFGKRKRFAYLVQAATARDSKLSGYPKDRGQEIVADYFVLTFKEKECEIKNIQNHK